MTFSRTAAVVVLAAALLALPAHADEASEAQLQYELGLELYKQKRYEEALQHLIASNRLVPNANVVFNIAQTYGLLHRDAEAFNWYQTYLSSKGLDAAGVDRGEKAVAALKPKVAVLEVTTTPPGAELFVDRVELGSVGQSPRKVAVTAGEHAVIAQLAGHHSAQANATATLEQSTPVALELGAIVGTLVVESEPKGAKVLRQGTDEVLGTTPLTLTLPLGEVRMRLVLDGYVEQQREATVKEETEARVKVALQAEASRVAVLSVSGTPDGAHVSLDGQPLGSVPLSVPGLKPGSFALEVAAAGYTSFSQRVPLEAGAATRVDVHLEPASSGRLRWLRWAGYGAGAVAVVTGVIVGIVAVSNRNTFFNSPSREALELVNTENIAADTLVASGLVVAAATFVLERFIWPPAYTRGSVELAR